MIFSMKNVRNIYVASGATDMRKSIDGLAVLVQSAFGHDPMDGSMFIFSNRARNRLKILYCDYGGFWLFTRRLRKGRFHIDDGSGTLQIDEEQLERLVEGLEFQKPEKKAYYIKKSVD